MDEAIELARTISSSCSQALIFTLSPQLHGSIDNTTVVTHRRLLEDKLMAFLAIFRMNGCNK